MRSATVIEPFTLEYFESSELIEALNEQGFDVDIVDLIPEFYNDSYAYFGNEFLDETWPGIQAALTSITGAEEGETITVWISW